MTRFVRTARRRFGQVSNTIASASRHVVPPNLTSWKLALYVFVFLLPGGSFVVLGMGWFENRNRRRAAKPRQPQTPTQARVTKLLPGPTPCSHGEC
ncbi:MULTISPECIES: hypothetical protein [unclassified Caballeronia]|uniref:hypothetical protein n=1 Tax=unclassified Caballeronia TaxID=2646786 RepID=UPI00285524B9|nr:MULTISPECIES: hypothetical protein [unclassified Caballeronia]MDR5752120.1 hypothetical protein [Caballeronia sp. LZ024]MDR5843739.1 hypothetical protein [Caballeronia sp. LZ031]